MKMESEIYISVKSGRHWRRMIYMYEQVFAKWRDNDGVLSRAYRIR